MRQAEVAAEAAGAGEAMKAAEAVGTVEEVAVVVDSAVRLQKESVDGESGCVGCVDGGRAVG